MRQPEKASAAPAASPASPPSITITFFKDILFRMAAEARLGDEHHFFRFGKTNALPENGEVQQRDEAEQRAVSMNHQPQRAAAVSTDESEQSRTFFVELPSEFGLEPQRSAHTESRFPPSQDFRPNSAPLPHFF